MTPKEKDWDELEEEMDKQVDEPIFKSSVRLFEDTFNEDEDEIDSLLEEYGF